jgi:hypothetical protein
MVSPCRCSGAPLPDLHTDTPDRWTAHPPFTDAFDIDNDASEVTSLVLEAIRRPS